MSIVCAPTRNVHETRNRKLMGSQQPVSYIQTSSSFALQIFTHYHKQHRCKAVAHTNINSDKCFLQGGLSEHGHMVSQASLAALASALSCCSIGDVGTLSVQRKCLRRWKDIFLKSSDIWTAESICVCALAFFLSYYDYGVFGGDKLRAMAP
jgi:hypothetical protein